VSDFPVLWRELRRPLMVKTWQRIAGVLVVAALLVLTYGAAGANTALKDDDFHITIGVVGYTLLMLFTCVLSATAIAQEKEGDTWTVLLASPLSGAAIVGAKTLGVMRRMLWPTVLLVAHLAVFTLAGVISPGDSAMVLWVLVTFNLIWLAWGIFLSLLFRKVTVAVICCLAGPVALYAALSLVVLVIDVMLDLNEDLFEQVTWYMPYYYIPEFLSRRHNADHYDMPGDIGNDVPFFVFAMIALIVGLAHAAIAAIVLGATAAKFDRLVGRAAQVHPLPASSRQPRLNFASGAG
jgi:ABC-type transport system involved in multi-copper enzyme maturation permease subunit